MIDFAHDLRVTRCVRIRRSDEGRSYQECNGGCKNIESTKWPKGAIGLLRPCPDAVLSSTAINQIHASDLPELRTDLVAALAALDVHEFTHVEE